MSYTIQHISTIIGASNESLMQANIEQLLIDSRKIIFPKTSLFFALHSNRRDGHSFINEVYERGVRNFVIDSSIDTTKFSNANFLKVKNTLTALQSLASYHRSQFNIPVIGITGSNGKTIVKEWLYQLLSTDYAIVRSPRSYNSQIGVPLSVWQINNSHSLAIFEAGISTVNEMEQLQKIIQPTIGILTNIGNAHDEGFSNATQKLNEKIKLFSKTPYTIARSKDIAIIKDKNNFKTWGETDTNDYTIADIKLNKANTFITIIYNNQSHQFTIPFIDLASIENVITCICVLLELKIDTIKIQQRILQLQPVEMRMQLKKAVNNCSILNDSYSNDLASLSIALDYLQQQSGNQKTTVILSDILQSGLSNEVLYTQVAAELKQRNIHHLLHQSMPDQTWVVRHLFLANLRDFPVSFDTRLPRLDHCQCHP
ncbi:MAG: Mur ligase family protein [Chitinophagaceae bacterium]|nr:Mur ligase family protein [Chitinophagaceae bacterium]